MLMDIAIPAFVVLFVAIDPVAVAPLFAALTEGTSKKHRRRMAFGSIVVGGLILAFFTVFGEIFLGALNISMDAFRLAGGVLLLLLALEMIFEKRTKRRKRRADTVIEDHEADDISVFPMGIPMIAGPGAITSVVLLMADQSGNTIGQLIIAGVLLSILLITLILLFMAGWMHKVLGDSITSAITRVLGVVLAAMAAQYVIDGLKGGLLS